MAIHPARFSGRPARPNLRLAVSLGRWGRVVKIASLTILAIGLLQTLRLAFALTPDLPNIPNQKPYPISITTEERTNLLLIGLSDEEPNFLAVASLKVGERVKYLPLDPELYVNLARDRGFYRLISAWRLGNLDGEGLNLLRDSVSRALAIPIDGYLATTESGAGVLGQKFGRNPTEILSGLAGWQFFSHFIDPKPWGGDLYGSMSGWQLLGLAWQARMSGGVEELSLAGTTIATSFNGETVPTIDPAAFDNRLGQKFSEEGVARERPRVSIVNSSELAGAASRLARYVRNLGGEVISVESGAAVANSEIRDHLGGSRLSIRLAPLIRATVSRDKEPTRADLEIIIGADNQGWF